MTVLKLSGKATLILLAACICLIFGVEFLGGEGSWVWVEASFWVFVMVFAGWAWLSQHKRKDE